MGNAIKMRASVVSLVFKVWNLYRGGIAQLVGEELGDLSASSTNPPVCYQLRKMSWTQISTAQVQYLRILRAIFRHSEVPDQWKTPCNRNWAGLNLVLLSITFPSLSVNRE